MAIKFEKKVIIGSLFSFLATAVGIIAIFFPDLLNLQKEKIEKLTLDVFTHKEAKQLRDFLVKRSEDEKIFELDLLFIADFEDYDENGVYLLDNGLIIRSGEPKKFLPESNFCNDDKPVLSDEKVYWQDVINLCGDNGSDNDIIKTLSWSDPDADYNLFYFDENFAPEQNGYSANIREPYSALPKDVGELSVMGVKGIFYVEDKIFDKEGDIPVFKSVSKEQLKLKNY